MIIISHGNGPTEEIYNEIVNTKFHFMYWIRRKKILGVKKLGYKRYINVIEGELQEYFTSFLPEYESASGDKEYRRILFLLNERPTRIKWYSIAKNIIDDNCVFTG